MLWHASPLVSVSGVGDLDFIHGLLSVTGAGGEAAEKMRARFANQKKKYDAQKDDQQTEAQQLDEAANADELRERFMSGSWPYFSILGFLVHPASLRDGSSGL